MQESIYNNFNKLMHIVKESNYNDDEMFDEAKKLFPNLDKENTRYDDLLTDMCIELYCYSRSLGFTIGEAANEAGLSLQVILKVYEGEGVSLEKLTQLVETELHVMVHTRYIHLRRLDIAGKPIDFLKVVYKDKYVNDETPINTNLLINTTDVAAVEKVLKDRGIPLPKFKNFQNDDDTGSQPDV